MPQLDGVGAIQRMKEDPRTRHIPVLVLTGHVAWARQQDAQRAGATAFLTKPCLPEAIEQVIGDILARAA